MKRILLLLLTTALLSGLPGAESKAPVSARMEEVVIPTWKTGDARIHPLFPDSGRAIYPFTLNDVLTDEKIEKTYRAVILENEYIRIMVLPEIGGRLHGAVDKTNDYVWIYWQPTIKPGLISMTGAWISGGIEWNFPHGHRPSGFQPVDHRIIHHPDGSATVWVGETEPIYRMRWAVGLTVYPGRSYVRADYRLINPTSLRHPFQFWATAATHANEWTQAQYPGRVVTGHGKREFWNWPVHEGVDLSWWKNVPNASSFFAYNSRDDWFGTYDHRADAGTVHVADHRLMPGKKLWTWGSGPSGRIWEDILTEGGGPYFEPQAGGFSDNQPDYHWIDSHEVKWLHDYWYPVRGIRGFKQASRDFALNTVVRDGKVFAGVYATGIFENHRIVLADQASGRILFDEPVSLAPDRPFTYEEPVAGLTGAEQLRLTVSDPAGKLLIELRPSPSEAVELPEPNELPGDPDTLNQDQLFHAGEFLDRHEKREDALPYYEAALERDPLDARVNVEIGFISLEQGRWRQALDHFDRALLRDAGNARLYFGKGLAYDGLGDLDQAYDQFFRATYSYLQFASAYLNLAQIDMRRGAFPAAGEKLEQAMSHNGRLADIPALLALVNRRMGGRERALAYARKALELDPMHFMGGYEMGRALGETEPEARSWRETWRLIMRDHAQNYLELALAYSACGQFEDAERVLSLFCDGKPPEQVNPMVNYFRAWFQLKSGRADEAMRRIQEARQGPVSYTNPHRLEGVDALQAALRLDPTDARAHLFQGNLLYAKGQREEGLAEWRNAVAHDPQLAFAWRNIGYAEMHLNENPQAAYAAYERAVRLAPSDALALLEMDQVAEELQVDPLRRLQFLLAQGNIVHLRDDLVLRLIELRLEEGSRQNLEQAEQLLRHHHFHIWEGRYGIHQSWVDVNQALGDLAFDSGDYPAALSYYQQATEYPKNLEVAPRTPDFRAHVFWNLARVYQALNESEKAAAYRREILAERYSLAHLGTFYQALAARAAGESDRYQGLLLRLEERARELTSGRFEYQGSQEIIGHYLLSLVLRERGLEAESRRELETALEKSRQARRLAVREAQLDVARAHQ